MSDTAPSEAVDEKTDQASGDAESDTVEIDTVLPHSVDHVWRVLTTNDGVQALLGPAPASAARASRGTPTTAATASGAATTPWNRSASPGTRTPTAPRSLVDLHLAAEGDGTRVSLRHEPAGPDRAALQRRWSDALDRLDALA